MTFLELQSMWLVIGLVSPVAWNVFEVCPSDMYLQVRQFFPQGYEPRGWLCCESVCNSHIFCPGAQSIHWLLFYKPFYNGNGTKARPQLPKNLSTRASFFSNWWKSQRMVINFDTYGALIAAIVFCLCSIFTAAVSINCLRYLFGMLRTLIVLSR